MYQIVDYCTTNVLGTATLLQAMIDSKRSFKSLVVASSMSAYGEGRYRTAGLRALLRRLRRLAVPAGAHIPECLDRIDWQDKKVLEIGLGQGAESEQLIRRGARWSGLDLTEESVDRVGLGWPCATCRSRI